MQTQRRTTGPEMTGKSANRPSDAQIAALVSFFARDSKERGLHGTINEQVAVEGFAGSHRSGLGRAQEAVQGNPDAYQWRTGDELQGNRLASSRDA